MDLFNLEPKENKFTEEMDLTTYIGAIIFILAFLLMMVIIFGFGIVAKSPPPTPVVSEIQAVPEQSVMVGDKITLNVDVSGDVTGYRWEATLGTLDTPDKSTTTYHAPDQPGEAIIKVSVTFGKGSEIQKSLVINIIEPTPMPTFTPTITLTPSPTPIPTNTLTPTPTGPPPILVASYTSCNNINELGGEMGGAFANPTNVELVEKYVEVEGRGCVVQISFDLDAWAGFYLKLEGLDLTHSSTLVFDVRSLTGAGIPAEIKIDLIRPGQCSVARISGLVEMAWTTIRVPLADFGAGPCKYKKVLEAWDQMEELAFVVEKDNAGTTTGQFELDNIRFEP